MVDSQTARSEARLQLVQGCRGHASQTNAVEGSLTVMGLA